MIPSRILYAARFQMGLGIVLLLLTAVMSFFPDVQRRNGYPPAYELVRPQLMLCWTVVFAANLAASIFLLRNASRLARPFSASALIALSAGVFLFPLILAGTYVFHSTDVTLILIPIWILICMRDTSVRTA